MSSFRARMLAGTLAIASLVLIAHPAHAAPRLTIVVTDVDPWQRFAERNSAALGLGVFPESRDAVRFVEEIGTGTPTKLPPSRLPVAGQPGYLGAVLNQSGISRSITGQVPSRLLGALLSNFGLERVGQPLDLEVFYERDPVRIQQIASSGPSIVLGVGARTPVWVAHCPTRCTADEPAVITGGIARRPVIVTPYDVGATILGHVGVDQPDAFIGNRLRSEPDAAALDRVRRLVSHLERGAGLGATMGATATVMAIAALALGLLLRWRGRRDLSVRAGQAATFASVGYMGALFVPTGDGAIRALAIAAAVVAGAAISARFPTRTVGRITLVIAGLFALLVVVAPVRPEGLPGSALWGNPLISWRFFGLQNFEVSFLAASVVIWGILAGLRPGVLAVACVAATVVIGAPRVGSNFVGVLTIGFGAGLAVIALVRRRVELWHAAAAVAIGAAAFVLALLADAGSPVSHGGRAARKISEGGFSTLVDLVEGRLRLNVDLIRSFPAGFLFMGLMLAIVGMLMAWGARPDSPARARVAVWAGAAMALVSLVFEDSGFYAGPIILVTAAAAWMIAMAENEVSSTASVLRRAGGG